MEDESLRREALAERDESLLLRFKRNNRSDRILEQEWLGIEEIAMFIDLLFVELQTMNQGQEDEHIILQKQFIEMSLVEEENLLKEDDHQGMFPSPRSEKGQCTPKTDGIEIEARPLGL